MSWLHFSAVAALAASDVADQGGGKLARVPATSREMSTDRPDTTESPYTVDAGRVQIEADLVSHTRDRREGTRTRACSAAAFNLRFGLSHNFEAGIFVAPWTRASEEPPGGPRSVRTGFGDVTLRGKVNFRGNDGDRTATGMIVDLTLPTAARDLGNDTVEGALSFPVAGEFGHGWEFGAMTRIDVRPRANGSGHRPVFVNTATLARELAGRLGGYVELTSEAGDGAHVATFDTGLTFHLNPDAQLDCGVKIGISRAADDLAGFAGISRRF